MYVKKSTLILSMLSSPGGIAGNITPHFVFCHICDHSQKKGTSDILGKMRFGIIVT